MFVDETRLLQVSYFEFYVGLWVAVVRLTVSFGLKYQLCQE